MENWSSNKAPSEVIEGLHEMEFSGYYLRRLKTKSKVFAHVLIFVLSDENRLRAVWKDINNNVAFYMQAENPSLLERSNYYIWFFIKETVSVETRSEIEEDMYSTKKYVDDSGKYNNTNDQIEYIEKSFFTLSPDIFDTDSEWNGINTVDIENFRIFRKQRHFSLRSISGYPTKLVMIYSGNGTGKTSFVDALEWAITSQVTRYSGLKREHLKGRILQHIESDAKDHAVVEISTSRDTLRRMLIMRSDSKNDLLPGKLTVNPKADKLLYDERKRWDDVFLPHHKIESFVSEDAATRFDEWKTVVDGSGEYVENFCKAHKKLRDIEKKKKEKEEALKVVERDRKKNEKSSHLLDNFLKDLEQYNEIASSGVLESFNASAFSYKRYLEIIQAIEIQISVLTSKSKNYGSELEYVNKQYISDVSNRTELLSELEALCEKNKKAQITLENCEQKKALQLQLVAADENLSKLNDELVIYQYISGLGSNSFNEIRECFIEEDACQKLSENKDLEQMIDQYHGERDRLQSKINKIDETIKNGTEVKVLREHTDRIIRLQADINNNAAELIISRKQLSGNERKHIEQKQKKARYEEIKIPAILENNDELSGLSRSLIAELGLPVERINVLNDISEKYKNLQNQYNLKQKQFQEAESLVLELSELVIKSRDYIKKQKIRVCPVCHTEFLNEDDLFQRTFISQSDYSRILAADLEKIQEEMYRQDAAYNEQTYYLNSFIKDHLSQVNDDMRNYLDLCNNEREKIAQLEHDIEIRRKAIEEISNGDKILGYSIEYSEEGFAKWHETWKTSKEEERRGLLSRINTVNKQIKETEDILRSRADRIDRSNRKLRQLTENYLRLFQKTSIPRKYFVSSSFEDIQNRAENLELEKIRLKVDIADKQDKLVKLQDYDSKMIGTLREELHSNSKREHQIRDDLNQLGRHIRENLSMIPDGERQDYSADELKKILSELQKNTERDREYLSNIRYSKDLENMLSESEKIEALRKKTVQELAQLDKQRSISLDAFENHKEQLEKRFREFVSETRFDDIYGKIAPHKEMRDLTCEFTYDDNNDRLLMRFKTMDREKKSSMIPELHFSTAQLNAVAFSLFLGKALMKSDPESKGAPIGSIIIDDPVGHFDEINVVSFADLLRNIVENTNKQLIITTHERDVYNLIRRKIPEREYPVRYIEL